MEVLHMKTREYQKDLKSVQNRLLHKSMAPSWRDLKMRIMNWMARSGHTWGTAIFNVLTRGMNQIEHEEKILRQSLQKRGDNILD
jgi:hypothetical protein